MASGDIAAAVAAAMQAERKIAECLNPGTAPVPAAAKTPDTAKKVPSKDVSKGAKRPAPDGSASEVQSAPPKKKRQTSSNWKKLRATLDAQPRRGRPPNFKKRSRLQGKRAEPADKEGATEKKPASTHSAFTREKVAETDGKLTKLLALDCEMVGVGHDGRQDALARVSVVNGRGDVVYDTFVRVCAPVTDYRFAFSGIKPEHVAPDAPNAEDLPIVRKRVFDMLQGRIVVGHALKNDFRVLGISHPWKLTRDTSVYFKALWKQKIGRRSAAPPKLATLAAQVLGVDEFQKDGHDSREDARAALALYKKHSKEWEASLIKKRSGAGRA